MTALAYIGNLLFVVKKNFIWWFVDFIIVAVVGSIDFASSLLPDFRIDVPPTYLVDLPKTLGWIHWVFPVDTFYMCASTIFMAIPASFGTNFLLRWVKLRE